MILVLPVLFFFVACLYAMAGFGGGSTYTALLAISGLPLAVVPIISLTCNLLVTSQGSYHLIKRGHAQWMILLPLLVGSIPAAFLGGAWRLPESTFLLLLAIALTLAGVSMLAQNALSESSETNFKLPGKAALYAVGVVLGLVAGVTGIGGGIYLAPVMHLMRWAPAKTIATCTSLFIALNSIAGLAGQMTKGIDVLGSIPVWLLISCPIAVLIGGRIGNHLLIEKMPQNRVRIITAIVILLVAIRLWLRLVVGL